jgi:tRNA wybutosine-synthesizing protein 1
MDVNLIQILKRQRYKLIGNFAVKLCQWTRYSIRNRGFCYKQKFYGIRSHRCIQMTPCVASCTHRCVFCWRAVEYTDPNEIEEPFDEKIIEKIIEAQRELLSGIKGSKDCDIEKFKEANNPNQVAISLSGEPTLFKKLPELIEAFKKRKFTVFVVSNGTNPEMIKKINPTQLYITLPAPNEEIYKKTCNPIIEDGWERINKSLEILKNKKVRRVMRLTLVKSINLINPKEYAEIIDNASPDYIECKAYMAVGSSRERLGVNFMPTHQEILNFAKEIEKYSSYKIKDEDERSRVVLLHNDHSRRSLY